MHLALQEKEAGSWLQALPSPNIGTLMDNKSFKTAVALRLGCNICLPHKCVCGEVVDTFGHHALSCVKSKGRFLRHSTINNIIKRALTSSGIPAILESTGISRTNGKYPAGLTLVPWSRGKSLMWDTTCVDTLVPSHLPSSFKIASPAAESAVCSKCRRQLNIHRLCCRNTRLLV